MAILFLIYILACLKFNMPVYWYEWAIFAFLEIVAIVKTLFTDQVKDAYNKGVREGMREIQEEQENIFSDV